MGGDPLSFTGRLVSGRRFQCTIIRVIDHRTFPFVSRFGIVSFMATTNLVSLNLKVPARVRAAIERRAEQEGEAMGKVARQALRLGLKELTGRDPMLSVGGRPRKGAKE